MKVSSTRDPHKTLKLSDAILRGLADDGGLYVPVNFPHCDLTQFKESDDYATFAAKLLHLFFHDEKIDSELPRICKSAFNFPVPLKQLDQNTYLLELFHGPTSSFKDFGARFLAECMETLASDNTKTTILVATSGDTGSAVASAFFQKPHANVIVLFPNGKISARQQQQIACWGENVLAIAVDGTFDDCQRLVKAAYQEGQHLQLSTANSINLGRLLPQMVYYAYMAWHFKQQHQQEPGFIVPSGNLGNVTACYWAKKLGFPIREIAIATNANDVLENYAVTGEYQPGESIATLANAMDVGNPSNFERLKTLFPDFANFKDNVTVLSVSDAQIKTTIAEVEQRYGEVICPHTATAFYLREQLSEKDWIIVATAEAAKFETVIEPILNKKIPVSKRLAALLTKDTHMLEISADMNALVAAIKDFLS
jgi:threonine synthase